jgi:hypothetical protein
MYTSTGGWTQTGASTYSGTPVPFKVFIPHGMANGYVAGSVLEFGPSFTATITPAQWTPGMTTVHEYASLAVNASATNVALGETPRSLTAVQRTNWYVSYDGADWYFVIYTSPDVYAVPMGSASVPSLLVTPSAESATHVAPALDDFMFMTTARG